MDKIKEEEFFKANVEGEWKAEVELVCSNSLVCSDNLILPS